MRERACSTSDTFPNPAPPSPAAVSAAPTPHKRTQHNPVDRRGERRKEKGERRKDRAQRTQR
eukprot:1948214-Rhodomonas_salina.2